MITLTIPNDDTIALLQFGKALVEIASAKEGHPVDVTVTPLVISTETLQQAAPQMIDELRSMAENCRVNIEPEVDTTAQQVESLGATHIITEQKLVGDPVPVGDDNFSQGYITTVEEIADPVDSTDTPWDERIHSASKALNADGTWRLRRKPKDMDEAEWTVTIQRVQDELRFPQEPVPVTPSGEELCIDEGYDHHGTPHICVTPEPPVTPPGDDFHTDEQTVAGIPPLPVPPPVVVAPPVTEWDFPRLMTFLTERHGKIDVATVNTLLAQDGMSSVQELNAHPDKIGPFVSRVKAHLGE